MAEPQHLKSGEEIPFSRRVRIKKDESLLSRPHWKAANA